LKFAQLFQSNQDGLPRNNTIESITLRNEIKSFVRLLNSMDAVKKIESDCSRACLNLSGLRLDVIAKIAEFKEDQFIYAPKEVPENNEEFETVFGQLLQRTSYWNQLKKIFIGHPSWLDHQNEFQLSLEFCKSLVNAAPKLKELKLYNVHPDFAAYLDANKPKKLKTIQLH